MLIICRPTFEFDYLGKFELIFEKNLGLNQGTRWVLLMKKPEVKTLMQVYL
jgi:hypothetical protein